MVSQPIWPPMISLRPPAFRSGVWQLARLCNRCLKQGRFFGWGRAAPDGWDMLGFPSQFEIDPRWMLGLVNNWNVNGEGNTWIKQLGVKSKDGCRFNSLGVMHGLKWWTTMVDSLVTMTFWLAIAIDVGQEMWPPRFYAFVGKTKELDELISWSIAISMV